MKMGPDAIGALENESGRAKHENGTRRLQYRRKRFRERKTSKWDPTPTVLPKTSPDAQNMKTGPDALGSTENESVLMFCDPGPFFGGTDGVGSHFHVLRALTHFRSYRWRRVPFSCFARPASFLTVSRASCPVFIFCATGLFFGGTEGVGPVFMFCAPGLIFGCTEGVGCRFHVLRS
jgi:hypothetical protein